MIGSARRIGVGVRDAGSRSCELQGIGTPGVDCASPVVSPAALGASVSGVGPEGRPIVDLSWVNPEGNPPDTSIAIQRATDANFTLNLTTFAAGPGQTTFVDKTSDPLTAYWYRVRAESAEGCSGWSEGVPVVTTNRGTP